MKRYSYQSSTATNTKRTWICVCVWKGHSEISLRGGGGPRLKFWHKCHHCHQLVLISFYLSAVPLWTIRPSPVTGALPALFPWETRGRRSTISAYVCMHIKKAQKNQKHLSLSPNSFRDSEKSCSPFWVTDFCHWDLRLKFIWNKIEV